MSDNSAEGRSQRADVVPRQPIPAMTTRSVLCTATVALLLTVASVVVLWWPATRGLNGVELVSARLDALKIGLSVAVGSGGVVALYLSWRRQRSTEADLDNRERTLAHQFDVLSHAREVATESKAHQERVAEDVRADAAERRITELYTKAADQLGSDHAAVRLAGLYALERLAQSNDDQRQMIVSVICAYLRVPHDLPTSGEPAENASSIDEVSLMRMQEREVRQTAQRILENHLRRNIDSPSHFWPDIDIDLKGAQLESFSLFTCHAKSADFSHARFIGRASFWHAKFSGYANFANTVFEDSADFDNTNFAFVRFKSTFKASADFNEMKAKDADFSSTEFLKQAEFENSNISASANFGSVSFLKQAIFDHCSFPPETDFDYADFAIQPSFDSVNFAAEPGFKNAKCAGQPYVYQTPHD